MPRRIGAKQAGPQQRAQLEKLHLERYGYLLAETHAEIASMSWVRAAQETARLTRELEQERRLRVLRVEAIDLHVRLFGRRYSADKIAEVHGMSEARVMSELTMLRRMALTGKLTGGKVG